LKLPRVTGASSTGASPLSGTFDVVEKRVLRHALALASGNKSEAARLLGLKRTTFLDKLRKHDLDDAPSPRAQP
jgi:DNA-binding NtrC family response regulator